MMQKREREGGKNWHKERRQHRMKLLFRKAKCSLSEQASSELLPYYKFDWSSEHRPSPHRGLLDSSINSTAIKQALDRGEVGDSLGGCVSHIN